MSALAPKLPRIDTQPEAETNGPIVAEAGMASCESPALALQARLSQSFEAAFEGPFAEPEIQKFHPAARLAIITGLAVAPWVAIGLAVRALVRL